jgi:O-6-methylguanine DNA methyltransferase
MVMGGPIFYWIADGGILGRLRLAGSEAGLCKLALGREGDDAFFAWLARVAQPSRTVRQRTPLIAGALDELRDYLNGALQGFETALDLRGTLFQRCVWTAVTEIPYGATSTYREIATQVGRPKATRAVGAANGANPLPVFVPCHRVLGVDGRLRGYGGGVEIKAALLKLERASPSR